MLCAMSRAAPSRERILEAAQRLAIERGFAATSVDAVLASAGASKGAFFHHFPTKSALGHALLERYAEADAATLDELMSTAEAEHDDPADQLIAFLRSFERVADELAPEQPGCLFVSFIYESGLGGDGVDDVVQRSIREWRGRILAKLEAIARRPSFPPVDLPSLADQVFTIFEGAFLLARALDDPTALRRQLEHLRHYVELLAGRPVAG
jgi:TetR/AcrR family transcriptional repressor of nem operon